MDAAAKNAARLEVALRYKRRRTGRISISSTRVAELQRLRRARYPQGITDTPAGRAMVAVMVHHLAGLRGDPRPRIAGFLEEHAPWLNLGDAKALTVDAIHRPRRWRADRLAWRIRLTQAERADLRITTIGAIDMPKAARIAARRTRDIARKRAQRQAAGATPRAEYEAASLARAEPWKAQGISRRTWYRRTRGTGPATA